MNILKESTRSICPVCFNEIDARVIEEGGQVYLIKKCSEHGEFKALIEKDASFYKRLMNKDLLDYQVPFINLAIPVSNSCDLGCPICYIPEKNPSTLSLEHVRRSILEFTGKFIWLTGGEPLLREELPQIIEYIVENGKIPVMLTNGLKLIDINYVRKLKKSGLRRINFSFNSFDDSVYVKINGRRLLKDKLKALRNIKKAKISTTISLMLVKGVNEHELIKIYRYCLRNSSFIKHLRVRSAVHIGRHAEGEILYLSELVKLISQAIGIREERIIDHCLKKGMHFSVYNRNHMPCHCEIDLFSLLLDEIGAGRLRGSPIRKIRAVFKLLPMVGAITLFKMIIRKLAGKSKLLDFNIYIRTWPDKYRLDLNETRRCPSGYLTRHNDKALPFCYSLILNEREPSL